MKRQRQKQEWLIFSLSPSHVSLLKANVTEYLSNYLQLSAISFNIHPGASEILQLSLVFWIVKNIYQELQSCMCLSQCTYSFVQTQDFNMNEIWRYEGA